MTLQPWDDRPHPDRGDKNANTTYAAVGRALTQWEYLEAKLAELFSQVSFRGLVFRRSPAS